MPEVQGVVAPVGQGAQVVGRGAKKAGQAVGGGAQRAARGGTKAVSRSGRVAGKAASAAARGTKKAASAVKENPMLAVAGAGIVGAVVGEIRNRSKPSSASSRRSTSRPGTRKRKSSSKRSASSRSSTRTSPRSGRTSAPSKSGARKTSTRKTSGGTRRSTKGTTVVRKSSARGGGSRTKRQVFDVEPRSSGQFAVQREKSKRAIGVFKTKQEAVSEGVRLARQVEKNGGLAQLRVKGENGRIQDERTYGRDPRSSGG
jgi:hypothetical protein